MVLAASNRTRSSPLSSSSPSRSTARGDNSANRVLRPSGGFGRPPGLPLGPGTNRPRSCTPMATKMLKKLRLEHLPKDAAVWTLFACTLAKMLIIQFVEHLRGQLEHLPAG